jgi:CelD/BcsL family acetyltransferase involved in cellulose biosynthesis
MAASPPDIEIGPVKDFAALAPVWLDLERRAAGSFFQSWAWTGCLAEERFPEAWLLSARRDGKVVALALFNRGPRARLAIDRPILLGESGVANIDAIFIEHNGLLLDSAEGDDLSRRCWAALDETFGRAKWRISGAPQATQETLPDNRAVKVVARRQAPYLELPASASDRQLLDLLSANTRQQLRRSLRAWEEIGPLQLDVAATHEEADIFLDRLADLHQLYWTGRGKPGAFADPFFGRFHHALLRRACDEQSVDLIRVSAGDRTVGYLYNFVHRDWVAAYQSGFDFGPDADRLRPGMICHLLAIEHYRRAGVRRYDFLGGDARYKRSFANAEIALLWLEIRRKSPWQSTHRTRSE